MVREADIGALSRKMGPYKVAVVCSYTISLVNFRFRLLQAMVRNGHEVVAFGPEYHQPTVDALADIGVAFVRIPMARAGLNPIQDLWTLAALWSAFRKFEPDVVLSYTMKPIIYGLAAARLSGVRQRHALITGLGYIFGDNANNPRLSLIRRMVTWMYRIALHGGGRVFVYNEADASDVRSGRMVSDFARIVPVPGSGIDFDRFTAFDVPAGDPVFLMVTRLIREKGVFEFIEAARSLRLLYPRARFHILGPIDPSPLAVSRDELDRWAAKGVIDYLGETLDVRPYLSASTVFVLPSYYREGIPRSIMEAMATGRAIITTDTPGCRDTVIEGENGFIVPPRDPVGLAAAMKRFIDDPALAERMGQRSLEIARTRFDARAVNQLLLREMMLLKTTDA
ncbi:glycosyltransferase family 4 protein [Mesorhizobium sp. M00.F.Ca.ET.216.01.1.1]|uniref:glycosyltransferase family 4 protein n=1 Tax=Mesorhizobium sp. M00.F.Ca.ET.216.01.1.1 TaxID=2500528 RepID=UPI001FE08720|nr:glycosyltransferase family 4 protein [Mesorhizobium sp. M00.F.Ca.ET.216.01.1.1]